MTSSPSYLDQTPRGDARPLIAVVAPANDAEVDGTGARLVALHEGQIERGRHVRARVNRTAVRQIAEAMASGAVFAAPVVMYDGSSYHLADGAHRLDAYILRGQRTVDCLVREGGAREALLWGVQANAAHGLRLTPADKRRAVRLWLDEHAGIEVSFRELGRVLGVSPPFIAKITRAWRAETNRPTDNVFTAPEQENVVLSGHVGENATLFADLLRLHVREGARIADVTYGEGGFWRRVPPGKYEVLASDLAPRVPGCAEADFRALPYADASLDAVVLDPPYCHRTHAGGAWGKDIEDRYRCQDNRKHADVLADYVAGATEAVRVLNERGVLIVKCQDETVSGRVVLTHLEINEAYRDLGLRLVDLFVLVQAATPITRKDRRQVHARRNHSNFMVFGRLLVRKNAFVEQKTI